MPNPRIENITIINEICSYGCEQKAKFKFVNGKFCCSRSPNKCSHMKTRNSNTLKTLYAEGKRIPNIFSEKKKKEIGKKISIKLLEKRNEKSWEEFSSSTKKKMVKEEQKGKCANCDIDEWLGEKIILEVHHIDGNNENNERDNLVGLCPNCHSLTNSWRKGYKCASSPKAEAMVLETI